MNKTKNTTEQNGKWNWNVKTCSCNKCQEVEREAGIKSNEAVPAEESFEREREPC